MVLFLLLLYIQNLYSYHELLNILWNFPENPSTIGLEALG